MNVSDAAQLLTVAAVYDNRKPSSAAAQAWAADLEGIEVAEAAAAIREHYRTNPGEWIMPGHIVAVVKRQRQTETRGVWLAELRAMRGVNPDDPEAVQAALTRARQEARRQDPPRLALLPGRFATPEAQVARNRRGLAAVRAELRSGPEVDRGRNGLAELDAAVAELAQPAKSEEAEDAA